MMKLPRASADDRQKLLAERDRHCIRKQGDGLGVNWGCMIVFHGRALSSTAAVKGGSVTWVTAW